MKRKVMLAALALAGAIFALSPASAEKIIEIGDYNNEKSVIYACFDNKPNKGEDCPNHQKVVVQSSLLR